MSRAASSGPLSTTMRCSGWRVCAAIDFNESASKFLRCLVTTTATTASAGNRSTPPLTPSPRKLGDGARTLC
jgi:hypothetical protein